MNLRNNYVRQLEQLDGELEEMAGFIMELADRAVAASRGKQAPAAPSLESLSSDVAVRERGIETLSLRLLLLQQPAAQDLREVSGALKVVTDLKRIGELSIDACRIAAEMGDVHFGIQDDEIAPMAAKVSGMVSASCGAYASRDLAAARAAAALDDEVDVAFADVRDSIIKSIFDGGVAAADAVNLLMLAKCFERIADHAENVAYWTEYLVQGTFKGEPLTVTGK